MGSSDYIPARDADLDVWANNFSTLLTASPGTYGLLSADATSVAGVFTTWHTAYLAATSPSTRTPTSITTKDDSKISMLAIIRPYAVSISQNQGVLSADKVAIGVNPRTNGPSPIPDPTTAPVLFVIGATPLQHTLGYHDSDQPETVKAKPDGVKFAEIRCSVSATPIVDQDAIDYKQMASKSPFAVNFLSADVGKSAYYCSRWINSNGKVGPWSSIVNFTVANG